MQEVNQEQMLSFGEISKRLIDHSKVLDKFGGVTKIKKIDDLELTAFEKFSEICAFEIAKSIQEMGSIEDYKNLESISKAESLFTKEALKSWQKYGEPFSELHNNITWLFNQGKNFDLDESLFVSLWNTNNNISLRKMPYNSIFINHEIEIVKGVRTFGISLRNSLDKEGKENIAILLLGFDDRDLSIFYYYFIIKKEGLSSAELNSDDFSHIEIKEIEKSIAMFVCNFLDFLNHPDVETRIVKWFNNDKRLSRGQLKILDKGIITVTGRTYKYVYEIAPLQRKKSPLNSFWVRGHYFHFWSKENYHRLYSNSQEELEKKGYFIDKQNNICKWVFPYIKGKGYLINKSYKLKNEKG